MHEEMATIDHVAGRTYFDLTVRQKIEAPGSPEFYATINNLFDVDPLTQARFRAAT